MKGLFIQDSYQHYKL